MKTALIAGGLALALAIPGLALADPAQADPAPAASPAFAYVVIEENARIPFGAHRINSWRVGRDGSLLLRVGVNDWYRATLIGPCERDLRFEEFVVVQSPPGGGVDRFATAIVDGRRCPFQTLDRIADPRETERAFDARPAEGPSS